MNTRSVNSAAGVVLAAMQQNRTPAGIALALEAAGLLMSPEAARDLASVSADAVAVAEKAVAELRREHEESARLRARVVELEAERKKYVGAEPTIAEEMAYLSHCIDSVLALCDKAEQQAGRWEQPLPVPEWVAEIRKAADGLVERRSYPPALPWARLMDHEDLTEFLDELAASAITHATAEVALAEVEATCGRWRAIAEAQHAHNTAPGPDAS